MSFTDLGLSPALLRAIADQGYTTPTPIQQQAIPLILDGQDVLASAQTGTGKTAGFTLPILQRLTAEGRGHRGIRALILTPTRELAAQVADSVHTYGRYLPLRSAVVFGGVKINPQIEKLRKGVDILIATPGRLLDHLGQQTVDLSQVEVFVLDEADRMLDMGFIHDIRKIMARVPSHRQTLLFSATFSKDIRKLADQFLNDPAQVEVARRNAAADTVQQTVHLVDRSRKSELLSYMIGSRNWSQVLVFTRTKHGANRLAQHLERDGLRSAAIHGNKSQAARTRALADFKRGAVRVLVATDIAARGLDIDQLPYVVNFELPNVPEDYVHRIGRTGRAGCEGEAVSLVCVDEHGLLKDIERLLKRDIPRDSIPGYEPDLSIPPEPIQPQRQSNRGRASAGSKARTSAKSKTSTAKHTPQRDRPTPTPSAHRDTRPSKRLRSS
jgi:ATP-dependent RNA helicase RhlE